MTVEVYEQLSKTAPFLLILVEELLTQVAELVLLHFDNEVVNTLNLIFYLPGEEAFQILKLVELSHCVVVDVCLRHVGVKDLIIFRVEVETRVLVFGDVSPLAAVLLLCFLLLKFNILLINLGQLVLFSRILIASWSLPLIVAADNLGDTALTEQEVEGHVVVTHFLVLHEQVTFRRATQVRGVFDFPGLVIQAHHAFNHNLNQVQVVLGAIFQLEFFDNAL